MSESNKATVIINDEQCEAVVGEGLLAVARRNGSHIGFVCDGAGWCATCECKVLSGAEFLNEQTESEKAWLHPERLATGYRFACRTRLEKPGTVKIISRAEILRRQFLASFNPPAGNSRLTRTTKLVRNLTTITVQYLERVPDGVSYSVNHIGPVRFNFPWRRLNTFLNDSNRVIDHQLDGEKVSTTAPVEKKAVQSRVVLKEEPFEDIIAPAKPVPVPALVAAPAKPVIVSAPPAPAPVAAAKPVIVSTPPAPAPVVASAPAPVVAPAPAPVPVAAVPAKPAVAPAPAPAPAKPTVAPAPPAPTPAAATPSTPFNFLPIEDIGPVFNQRLFEYGIYSYSALAALSAEEIAFAVDTSIERVERNKWREQAAKLAAEGN